MTYDRNASPHAWILALLFGLLAACGGGGGADTPMGSGDDPDTISDPPFPPPPPPPPDEVILASSDFDAGRDGWVEAVDGNGDQFLWTADEGVGGTPALSWDYWSAGTVNYFAAGAHLLGAFGDAEGGLLRFDLDSGAIDPDPDEPLVILDGRDGLRIGAGFETRAAGWTLYEIPLDVTGGWVHLRAARLATAEEIRTVLDDLVDLKIRAVAGPALLDNVEIVAGPGSSPRIPGPVLVEADFEAGASGWSVAPRPNGDTFSWVLDGGRDGAGFEWYHWNGGSVTYFHPPAVFLGDRSDAYGGALAFDLYTAGYDRGLEALVVLVAGDGTRLEAHFDDEGEGWLRYHASLDVRGGWRVAGAARLATNAEIAAVLADLVDLGIRAVSGPAVLDNVRLLGPDA